MGRTSIEWATDTWNPGIFGCAKVSEACRGCYAMAMAHRQAAMGNYPQVTRKGSAGPEWTGEVFTADPSTIEASARRALPAKRRGRVFVTSMGDPFHPDVPDAFVGELWRVMASYPHLLFLVLTKRPERAPEVLHRAGVYARAGRVPCPVPNVWVGATMENQQRADERMRHLLQIPAAGRFVSAEPLLGPINFHWGTEGTEAGEALREAWKDGEQGISWLITGGESGHRARPTDPRWFEGLRAWCAHTSGISFFFKQWGEWLGFESHDRGDTLESIGPKVHPSNVAHLEGRRCHIWKTDGDVAVVASMRVGRQLAGTQWRGEHVQELPASFPCEHHTRGINCELPAGAHREHRAGDTTWRA